MAAKKKAPRTPAKATRKPEQGVPSAAPKPPPVAPPDNHPEESKPEPSGPPIAGIGASAGGLDAFKKFFTAMPAQSGIAFVLIPHLDPKHESLMVELIARHTSMPVVEAENDMPVAADHVYILPPNKYMTIAGGVLKLTGPVERGGLQTSIDLFLRSLADDQQERAICIILSGTGGHGALGLKAVKAAGGMAMVQDPATADYPRMPQSAVATGLADYVLPVEQMPEALVKYVKHFYVNGGAVVGEAGEVPDHLNQVLALLRARTKFDFRSYRKKMLTRRVERRMGLSHCENLADYLAQLRRHPDEVKQLARDLFISVTNFFRDPDAFRTLETEVIAPLVRAREPDTPVRVWVPGCATGEEPYSLAILLLEQLAPHQKSCPLQIFATDVDEAALEVARQGVYPESISADVAPERLARYFTRLDESSYQVSKQVREPVVFALQNLISDAPFSKLDLISCRNLLIYLEPEVQKKVVTLLHFALAEGGYLFLGPSETIGRQTDLFETVSKKWRIFRRIGPRRPERVEFPIGSRKEQPVRRLPEPAPEPPVHFAELTHRLVLEQLGPAAVLINRRYEVLYFLGPITRYLDVPTGEPTRDLMLMAREGLQTKLRAAVHKSIRENEAVVTPAHVKRNGTYCPIAVTVKPVHAPKSAEGLLLITFQDQPEAALSAPPPAAEEAPIRQLENELRATKEDLQGTIEELESANEELKASNEEVMSMNEELQSTNEELETSKEELQSLNEELATVNNQLQDKVQDLETATDAVNDARLYAEGIVETVRDPLVVLDGEMKVLSCNPAFYEMFHVDARATIGRPLYDLGNRQWDIPELRRLLQDILPHQTKVTGYTVTCEFEDIGQRIMLLNARLITRGGGRENQILLAIEDATERIQAEDGLKRVNVELERQVAERTQSLREREERLQAILNTATDAVITTDQGGVIQSVNPATERMFGYPAAEMIGQNATMLMPSPYREEHDGYLTRYLRTSEKRIIGIGREAEGRRKDGTIFPVDLAVSEIEHLKLFTGIIRDSTRRKELEHEVIEIAALEQRRIGQELHDDVSQHLTGLRMLADALVQKLSKEMSPHQEMAAKVAVGLDHVRQQARALSMGLIPVDVRGDGLQSALEDLAARTKEQAGVACTLDCPAAIALPAFTATHLLRIAQESVHNALRHGKARNIALSLVRQRANLILSIRDDGIGIPLPADETKGLGIRLMRNRASLVGGSLEISPTDGGGTVVTCTVPWSDSHG